MNLEFWVWQLIPQEPDIERSPHDFWVSVAALLQDTFVQGKSNEIYVILFDIFLQSQAQGGGNGLNSDVILALACAL